MLKVIIKAQTNTKICIYDITLIILHPCW